jgi:acyl-CoA thioesterase-1
MRSIAYLAGCLLWLLCVSLANASSEPKTILVWGDSLSAAYGMPVEKGWVSLLENKLESRHYHVVNGSISGETTRGGLSRLPVALAKHAPEIVVLELGANDGLRGLPIAEMEKNLLAMVRQAQSDGAAVLLLGMQIPPNYGPAYTRDFSAAYRRVAEQTGAVVLPFFLQGVAENFDLMQADGIHPVAQAQPQLLEHVWRYLQAMLD